MRMPESPLMSEWALFILFTDLYSRSLLTMSDDEFFGPRNFLQVPEIISMSAVLKVSDILSMFNGPY